MPEAEGPRSPCCINWLHVLGMIAWAMMCGSVCHGNSLAIDIGSGGIERSPVAAYASLDQAQAVPVVQAQREARTACSVSVLDPDACFPPSPLPPLSLMACLLEPPLWLSLQYTQRRSGKKALREIGIYCACAVCFNSKALQRNLVVCVATLLTLPAWPCVKVQDQPTAAPESGGVGVNAGGLSTVAQPCGPWRG